MVLWYAVCMLCAFSSGLTDSDFSKPQAAVSRLVKPTRHAAADVLGEESGNRRRRRRRRSKPSKPYGGSFNWTQCKSEGGDKNCALCSDVEGGALPCPGIHKECRDDRIAVTGKFFQVQPSKFKLSENHKPELLCTPLDAKEKNLAMTGEPSTVWGEFPGLGKESMVLTKVRVSGVHLASSSVGVLIFKRLVTHTCTGKGKAGSCTKGARVADVYKEGYCIKCRSHDGKRTTKNERVFAPRGKHNEVATEASLVTDDQRREFLDKCLKRSDYTLKAIDKDGNIEPKFECKGDDLKKAEASIVGF